MCWFVGFLFIISLNIKRIDRTKYSLFYQWKALNYKHIENVYHWNNEYSGFSVCMIFFCCRLNDTNFPILGKYYILLFVITTPKDYHQNSTATFNKPNKLTITKHCTVYSKAFYNSTTAVILNHISNFISSFT